MQTESIGQPPQAYTRTASFIFFALGFCLSSYALTIRIIQRRAQPNPPLLLNGARCRRTPKGHTANQVANAETTLDADAGLGAHVDVLSESDFAHDEQPSVSGKRANSSRSSRKSRPHALQKRDDEEVHAASPSENVLQHLARTATRIKPTKTSRNKSTSDSRIKYTHAGSGDIECEDTEAV